MSIFGESSDIHVRLPLEDKRHLQALTHKINQARMKADDNAEAITVSDVVRAAVTVMVNKRLNLLEADNAGLIDLSRELLRIGTNLNQVAHAYNAGLLIHPVNASNLFLELQSAVAEAMSITKIICRQSATFNTHFLYRIQTQIDSIKPAD